MAYKSEISFAANKVETQNALMDIVYKHLSDVKGFQFWIDLPCKNFYVPKFATDKFGNRVKVIAYEKDKNVYNEVKNNFDLPTNVEYIKGNIFDSRNIKFHFVNADLCSSYTAENSFGIQSFILHNEFPSKCVLSFNQVKQRGMAGVKYKESGFQEEIAQSLYRKGFKSVKHTTIEYDNGTSTKSTKMINSIFICE